MPRRSRPSARPSTTSPRTSSSPGTGDPSALGSLIDELPPERLEPVFTLSSWAPDRASSYERLEFLGDCVLELAVARELYERYPDFSEGRMAKIRSHVVSRASCAVVARELGLGARLAAQGKDVPAEEVKRLTANKNVLAALLEAALAALFLERGFEAIERAVVAAFQARIQYALTTHVDHKTELQEALARRGLSVNYTVLDVDGPPHDRRFKCAAIVDGEQRGVGTGASKKAAEQEAAKEAFEALGLEAAPAA
ncbi:MAG: ribonuclease [Gaiellaceae bacterium]|nr:ribonuclease [Gaiellaceae bacterium]